MTQTWGKIIRAVRIETFLLFQFGDSWVTSCPCFILVTTQTSWVALVWITTSISIASDPQICIWICKICGSEAFWEPNRLPDWEFFHLQIAERTQNNWLVCCRFKTPPLQFPPPKMERPGLETYKSNVGVPVQTVFEPSDCWKLVTYICLCGSNKTITDSLSPPAPFTCLYSQLWHSSTCDQCLSHFSH